MPCGATALCACIGCAENGSKAPRLPPTVPRTGARPARRSPIAPCGATALCGCAENGSTLPSSPAAAPSIGASALISPPAMPCGATALCTCIGCAEKGSKAPRLPPTVPMTGARPARRSPIAPCGATAFWVCAADRALSAASSAAGWVEAGEDTNWVMAISIALRISASLNDNRPRAGDCILWIACQTNYSSNALCFLNYIGIIRARRTDRCEKTRGVCP